MERWKGKILRAGDYSLRPLFVEDVGAAYLSWLHDSEVTRFLEIGRAPPKSVGEVQDWVAKFDGVSRLIFGVFAEAGSRHIGNVTLYAIDRHSGVCHYGLMIGDRSYWGKAVVTSIMPPVFDFVFGELGLRRITAGASARNLPTIINFKKLGLQKEGVFRKHLREGEAYVDEVRYGLLREEWESRQGEPGAGS